MQPVRAWLEGLGLEEYADVFAENSIGIELLSELDHDLLKDIGVSSAGHRLQILKAAKSVEVADSEPAPAAAAPAAGGGDAERRQITVMFCDLVGSTALSERLDPEDLRAVMQAYQRSCGEIIARYDGYVAQYLGDGLMTYFGWPQAHEDDAERAMRAALEITEAIKSVEAPEPLAVRIGIATGAVVVGDSGSGDDADSKLAVGETPNLAARAQGIAGPDEVVIAATTRRLVGGTFELDDLGSHAVKGIVEPVQLWRVSGITDAEDRFAARAARLTPMVGRETEITLVMGRWEQAKAGEGHVVLLSGEPGIGKSRITQALRERLADEDHTRLRYQCSPYYSNSALYPFIAQIEHAAGFARGDDNDTRLEKLEAIGGAIGKTGVTLIAAMLSLDISRYPPLDMSPQKQKDETLKAVADWALSLAAERPVLMIFEDAHWIDPTSQELLDLLVPLVEGHRILLLITYRPEYEPPWRGLGHLVPVTLTRLGRGQAAAMVERVTDGKALPDEVLDQIIAKTDGVPLFVEELTKTVIESGILVEADDGYALSGPLADLAIPSSLRDSLMARLDRLSPVKEVAQIGACIGRTFGLDLLAAVSPLHDNALSDALQQLMNSELIYRSGTPPDISYTFKHALVQDTAYESLLRSRRQQLHATIAGALEEQFSDLRDNEPEVLARHFAAADMFEPAIRYWCRAGNRALAHWALKEAIGYFEGALTAVERLPKTEQRARLELDSRLGLGTAHIALFGWSHPRVGEVYPPAVALAESLDDKNSLFDALFGIFAFRILRGQHAASLDAVNHMVRATPGEEDTAHAMIRNWTMGHHKVWTGELQESGEWAARTRRHYSREKHGEVVLRVNNDPLTMTLTWEAQRLWFLGRPDKAVAVNNEGIGASRSLGHVFDYLFALTMGTMPYVYRREVGEAAGRLQEAATVAAEQNLPFFEFCVCPMFGGFLDIATGEHAAGLERMTAGTEAWSGAGGVLLMPFAHMLKATALLGMDRVDEARDSIEEALDLAQATGERMHVPEILRVRGDIALRDRAPSVTEAEAEYSRAIEEAADMQARGWQLRAATSLARLWHDQGRNREARELLAPLYEGFDEGFDTPDLTDAKTLLAALS